MIFFALGLIVNGVIAPLILIAVVMCLPCFFCIKYCMERQEIEQASDSRIEQVKRTSTLRDTNMRISDHSLVSLPPTPSLDARSYDYSV